MGMDEQHTFGSGMVLRDLRNLDVCKKAGIAEFRGNLSSINMIRAGISVQPYIRTVHR